MDENDGGGPAGRPGQFQPGNRHSLGRPRGSRNKLGEQFLLGLYSAWTRLGEDAIDRMAKDTPGAFVRVVAQTLPRYLHITVNEYDHLSDAELLERFIADAAELGLVVQPAGGGDEAAEAGVPRLPKPD